MKKTTISLLLASSLLFTVRAVAQQNESLPLSAGLKGITANFTLGLSIVPKPDSAGSMSGSYSYSPYNLQFGTSIGLISFKKENVSSHHVFSVNENRYKTALYAISNYKLPSNPLEEITNNTFSIGYAYGKTRYFALFPKRVANFYGTLGVMGGASYQQSNNKVIDYDIFGGGTNEQKRAGSGYTVYTNGSVGCAYRGSQHWMFNGSIQFTGFSYNYTHYQKNYQPDTHTFNLNLRNALSISQPTVGVTYFFSPKS